MKRYMPIIPRPSICMPRAFPSFRLPTGVRLSHCYSTTPSLLRSSVSTRPCTSVGLLDLMSISTAGNLAAAVVSRESCLSPSSDTSRTGSTKASRPAEPSMTHITTARGTPTVYSFFDNATSTWTYVVVDLVSSAAVVIDPVLDYDSSSGQISTHSADGILNFIDREGLKVCRILETHAHADHLTAAQYFKRRLSGNVPVCIGSRIKQVQKTFAPVYDINPSTLRDAFDICLDDEEEFPLGGLSCRVIHLPGHTPDHIGYVLGRAVFTGDSIFMPDVGSARADFPGGSVKDLYSSMQRLLSLPSDHLLFVGHDYPNGRAIQDVITVGVQRERNAHVKAGTDESTFVNFRAARDAILGSPKLLHPSLQVNICAGKLPPADDEGRIFFKIPVEVPP